jgi:anti-anti-sigma regulatory factor
MPTQITQVDDPGTGHAIFRVEGQVMRDDAVLLDRITQDFAESTGRGVDIDLADVDFIDSDAAPILKRLQSSDGIRLIGMEILLQNAVNEAERR